jgi:hypothetical protein
LLESNGSATGFVKQMISEILMAGEDLPDEIELKSNCVSEYMNKEMVCD